MTRVRAHTGCTIWGPQNGVDRPERLRKMTRIRRRVGERRYRELRYSMSVAHAGLRVFRLVRDMNKIKAELEGLSG